jgi:hypothetical protein
MAEGINREEKSENRPREVEQLFARRWRHQRSRRFGRRTGLRSYGESGIRFQIPGLQWLLSVRSPPSAYTPRRTEPSLYMCITVYIYMVVMH